MKKTKLNKTQNIYRKPVMRTWILRFKAEAQDDTVSLYALMVAIFLLLIIILCAMRYYLPKQKTFSEVQPKFEYEIAQLEQRISPMADRHSEPVVSLYIPPEASEFKSYMDYRKITNKSSAQWQYQKLAHTDKNGFRRINEYYMVALGTYYINSIGDKFRISLDTGKTFSVVAGDFKANEHTVNGQYTISTPHNLVEFIIDIKTISKQVLLSGDVSKSGFVGKVISIERIKT